MTPLSSLERQGIFDKNQAPLVELLIDPSTGKIDAEYYRKLQGAYVAALKKDSPAVYEKLGISEIKKPGRTSRKERRKVRRDTQALQQLVVDSTNLSKIEEALANNKITPEIVQIFLNELYKNKILWKLLCQAIATPQRAKALCDAMERKERSEKR